MNQSAYSVLADVRYEGPSSLLIIQSERIKHWHKPDQAFIMKENDEVPEEDNSVTANSFTAIHSTLSDHIRALCPPNEQHLHPSLYPKARSTDGEHRQHVQYLQRMRKIGYNTLWTVLEICTTRKHYSKESSTWRSVRLKMEDRWHPIFLNV